MRAHEAGALHGDIDTRGPGWLRTPDDVNTLMPGLWPTTVERGPDGALTVGGIGVHDLAASSST